TDGAVFRVLDGSRPMGTAAIQKRFKKLAREAGIPAEKRHPHCMRHGFATRMLFDTKTIGGIYTVSKLLGHSRVAVTEMYLHCSQKQLEQAMLADPLGAGV
ncbi:MAG: site-specific integrase, partial [Anaerolineales bacterium]|nr:site-specific integrase [Anaerolineales bacterium]